MGERLGIALLVLALQAFAAFLFTRGVRLPGRFHLPVHALFIVMNLPLPYVLWLQAGARQPPLWLAAAVVRPFFAWQSSWFTFSLFFGISIGLTRLAVLVTGYDGLLTFIRGLAVGAAGFWTALAVAGLIGTVKAPEVTRVKITLPGLRPADRGVRVALLSDVHVAWWNSKSEIDRIGKIIADEKPDLLLVAGDMVDHHPAYTEAFADALEAVRPRLGRFAVIGNHDVYTGRNEVARRMTARGIVMLRRTAERLDSSGARITVAGFDDSGQGWTKWDPASKVIPELVSGLEAPIILLAHRPPPLEGLRGLPPMLILSGHTHGGQVRLPFGGPGLADLTFDYTAGKYRKADQTLYVTRGVGHVGWPFRIFCPAEITVIALE